MYACISLPIANNIHFHGQLACSGFDADALEGQGNHLDLDRCAQYMAGKLTDYYCAKKALESKDFDDTSIICKRREQQLSYTVSENSIVLAVTYRIHILISYMLIMVCYRSLYMWVRCLVLHWK